MQLAFVSTSDQGATDPVLAGVAHRLLKRGLTLCGTVQTNTARAGGGPCDMDVTVLPDGPLIRISQYRGPMARGCRLDPAGLESAVDLVRARLCARTDLLIVNKFGKHEADGRGFRDLIAEAMMLEVPVLLGVNPRNRPAFDAFSCGMAVQLPARADAIFDWALGQCAAPQDVCAGA